MSRVLVIGGGGMLGQKLARALAREGLAGAPDEVTLFDLGFPEAGAPAARRVAGSVTDAAAVRRLIRSRPDVIFHLAAIVAGEAEADFDKGWQTNMLAFWSFLETVRAEHAATGGDWVPRIVFTSSIAVFGAPYPDRISDEYLAAPQTSYGAQKAICELMLSDLARRGLVEGVSLRLPTVTVRPGKPNKAASGFFSGIMREPLNGQEALLPVPVTVRHWHASPRAVTGFLRHAATMDLRPLGHRRALNMPGVSCTVEEQIETLRAVAGAEAVALIRPAPDETIGRIVAGWPREFDPARALALGFRAEGSFRAIVDAYLEDDLRGA
jgi:nucleoside-diphosphate-sugar epimerase